MRHNPIVLVALTKSARIWEQMSISGVGVIVLVGAVVAVDVIVAVRVIDTLVVGVMVNGLRVPVNVASGVSEDDSVGDNPISSVASLRATG
jgi:hypothetical protein